MQKSQFHFLPKAIFLLWTMGIHVYNWMQKYCFHLFLQYYIIYFRISMPYSSRYSKCVSKLSTCWTLLYWIQGIFPTNPDNHHKKFTQILWIHYNNGLCRDTGWPNKNGTVDTVDFSGLCSDQQLSFLTLLDRASLSHYNTKIIKFGWELFILWVISYGL